MNRVILNLESPGLVVRVEETGTVFDRRLNVVIAGDMNAESVVALHKKLGSWLRSAVQLCDKCDADERINRAGGYGAQAQRCRDFCLSGHDHALLDRPAIKL